MTKGGLGRGLSALISEKSAGRAANVQSINVDRNSLPLAALTQSRFQPRSFFKEEELNDLADSIRKNGVVQPIIVREDAAQKGLYEIIAGERRWRAAKMAGLKNIPVIIMTLSDKQALEIALVENIQRQNLMALEEAEGYQRLINEFGYTQEELSDVIGKSRSQIANTLRLLALPEPVKDLLNDEKISAGHARALLSAKNASELAETIIKKDLSVRQTEKLVRKLEKYKNGEPAKKKSDARKDEEIIALEQELSKKLGLDLTITNKDEHGQVIIAYHSLAELDAILRRLEN